MHLFIYLLMVGWMDGLIDGWMDSLIDLFID